MVSLAIGDDASDAPPPSRGVGLRYETVDEGFRGFVARTFGDEGRAWLARLPAVHAELEERWRLRLGRELPGGLLSSVHEVALEDGTRAVLKIGRAPRARDEIAALRIWAGRGAPTLLAADEEACAMLLEPIEPGNHPDPASPEAVAGLLVLLHMPLTGGLPSLASVARERVRIARRDGRASAQKAAWALAKVDELAGAPDLLRGSEPQGGSAGVLLHGDLDERNLVVCARRGLCAIDPLPCVGDPAYDAGYWVHGNRRPGRRARLDAIVAATGLERERVRDWAAVVGVHG
jgi:streptomycin 6-kinase